MRKNFPPFLTHSLTRLIPAGLLLMAFWMILQSSCSNGTHEQSFTQAETQFRNRPELKGKKLLLANNIIFWMDNRILLSIQSPDTPQVINTYVYKGGRWHGPWKSVSQAHEYCTGPRIATSHDPNRNYDSYSTPPVSDMIRTNYFLPLDSFRFAWAAHLHQQYNAKLDYLNSKDSLFGKYAGYNTELKVLEYSVAANSATRWEWHVPTIGETRHLIGFDKHGNVTYLVKDDNPGYQPHSVLLTDTAALNKAEQAFRHLPELAGKRINLYGPADFDTDNGIKLSIQDPDTLQYVNKYTYQNGQWSNPEPQIDMRGLVTRYLMPLDKLPFAAVGHIAAVYAVKARELHSTAILKEVLWQSDNTNTWQCSPVLTTQIHRSTTAYDLVFHADGSLKVFRKQDSHGFY